MKTDSAGPVQRPELLRFHKSNVEKQDDSENHCNGAAIFLTPLLGMGTLEQTSK
jgi:hypothetical protein